MSLVEPVEVIEHILIIGDVGLDIIEIFKEITHLIVAAVTQCEGWTAILIGLKSQAAGSAGLNGLVELIVCVGGVHGVVMNLWTV